MHTDVKALLLGVQDGTISVDDALLQLKQQQFCMFHANSS